MSDKVSTFVDEFKRAQEEMAERGKTLFKEVTAELFEKYEDLEWFSWNQYTPYFADGDVPQFRVNADTDYGLAIKLFSQDEELGDEEGLYRLTSKTAYEKNPDTNVYEQVPNKNFDPTVQRMADDITGLVSAMPETVLMQLFGDHAEVTITREGATVEEHDHE